MGAQRRLQFEQIRAAIHGKSPYYTNGTTRPRFDAQSWGVIHYMLFGLADGGTARVSINSRNTC